MPRLHRNVLTFYSRFYFYINETILYTITGLRLQLQIAILRKTNNVRNTKHTDTYILIYGRVRWETVLVSKYFFDHISPISKGLLNEYLWYSSARNSIIIFIITNKRLLSTYTAPIQWKKKWRIFAILADLSINTQLILAYTRTRTRWLWLCTALRIKSNKLDKIVLCNYTLGDAQTAAYPKKKGPKKIERNMIKNVENSFFSWKAFNHFGLNISSENDAVMELN